MKNSNSIWIPSFEFILETFRMLSELEECSDLKHASCVDISGILGIIDKITFGWPGNEDPTIIERAAILINDLILYHYFNANIVIVDRL